MYYVNLIFIGLGNKVFLHQEHQSHFFMIEQHAIQNAHFGKQFPGMSFELTLFTYLPFVNAFVIDIKKNKQHNFYLFAKIEKGAN